MAKTGKEIVGQFYCKTCNKLMDRQQFYISRRTDKYPPDGVMNECKFCLTRHVNNYDPDTFKWILEEIDIPYIEKEWTNLLNKHGTTPLTGVTILGRYIGKMRLSQYKKYRWADSEAILEEQKKKMAETMAEQGYSEEEIQQAIERGTMPEAPAAAALIPADDAAPQSSTQDIGTPAINLFESEYFQDDLTEEDKKYLTLKWGKAYRPHEWVQLEQLYQDMINAFDIQTPAHIDYLKLICKTSLKSHQLVDLGDVEGFQKMSKVYDTLMKSAKFTAAQNKSENGEYVNSISELVLMCERDGFVPRYYVDKPNDKVDAVLADNRRYVDTLVREELNLGDLIEQSLRTIQKESQREEYDDTDDDEELTEANLEELKDEDFAEYNDFLDAEISADDEDGEL